jgi:hypothetical protein
MNWKVKLLVANFEKCCRVHELKLSAGGQSVVEEGCLAGADQVKKERMTTVVQLVWHDCQLLFPCVNLELW